MEEESKNESPYKEDGANDPIFNKASKKISLITKKLNEINNILDN